MQHWRGRGGGRLLSCLEKFPNIFREKKEPQEIVLNKFLTNSDINIFGIYSEYIRRNFFPNILKKKYVYIRLHFENLELFPKLC